jgi:putative transposase
MRRYRTGAHAKYDLKVHIVWVPKYRKRILTGPVAVRTRDLLRQIATENDLGEPVQDDDSRFQIDPS